MNLILLRPEDFGSEGEARVTGSRADHMVDVLRVSAGAHVRVGLVDGPMGQAMVTAVGAGRVELRCAFESVTPSRPPVDVLLALPRPKVMRRLWPQLAALGVGRIVLTNAERVERPYFDTHVLTEACYGPLLIEGLQQARDTRVPLVSIHRQFRKLIEDEVDRLSDAPVRLVAHPGSDRRVTAAIPGGQPRVLLAIGPEGGWNDFELALLESRGFVRVAMGPRTLRSDTATIALLALAHSALGGPHRQFTI